MTRQRWLAAAAVWLSLYCLAASVRAEDPPSSSVRARPVALFKTATTDTQSAPLAAALDPVLQAQLAKVATVTVVSQPALDLPSMQLALDCVGETPSCLTLVAERTHVVGLLAPTVTRTDNVVVLSLLWYDPEHQPAMRVVTQQVPVSDGDDAVLARVPVLLGAVFGGAEAAAPVAPTKPAGAAQAEPAIVKPAIAPTPATPESSPEPAKPSLLLPIVLGAAGVVVIATGIAFGVAADSSEDTYARTRVINESDAARARDRYDNASSYALISNVALGVGAAALLAGAVVFSWDQFGHPSKEHARTRIGVGLAQVSLSSTWN